MKNFSHDLALHLSSLIPYDHKIDTTQKHHIIVNLTSIEIDIFINIEGGVFYYDFYYEMFKIRLESCGLALQFIRIINHIKNE